MQIEAKQKAKSLSFKLKKMKFFLSVKIIKRSILLFLLILLPLLSCSQQINRFKNKEKQGKWIIYYDSAETRIDNTGRYRKGIPKGKWKYYDENCTLIKTEKYRFKKIHTTSYHSNGKIKKKGKAKIVKEARMLHYYYYGNWLVYDSLGILINTQVYEKGTMISETEHKATTEKNTNDSLVMVLKVINRDIYKYHDSVRLAESIYGKSSMQYQRAVSLNTLHSSKLLTELDMIISKFGYPGKTLTGKEYAIAFSIISSANLKYKEKYYDLIIDAANKRELDWIDVAFFVDKINVAKKEKQVYGTQYKIDETLRKLFYYPIDAPEKLNERRKKVGLDEIDIMQMSFIDY